MYNKCQNTKKAYTKNSGGEGDITVLRATLVTSAQRRRKIGVGQ
jgi:hypothetical protein